MTEDTAPRPKPQHLPKDIVSGIKEKQTFFQRPDQLHDPLYVITTVFNATRYRVRWQLYQDFAKMVAESGAILYTVEVAFGQRDFSCTEPDNPHHLQLRTSSEIWHKENATNLIVQRLPQDWKYVACIDSDITFARSDWADETLHQLQHYAVVQMWSEAEDLSPKFQGLSTHHSFVYSWLHNEELGEGYYYQAGQHKFFTAHPGFAWAWNRWALNAVGGQIEVGITGANDNSQARGLIGIAEKSLHPDIGGSYREIVMKWQKDALLYIKKNIGLVEGKILHYWHGKKVDRGYWTRWKILVRNKFEPFTDLKRDWQGLFQLVVEGKRQQKLRDGLRKYFRARDEDSIDTE